MYSTWSAKQLKEELKKRKALTTGKKSALIERLEACDRNLICIEEVLEDDSINIPAPSKFRDINASTKLPALSKRHIQEFAERFQVPAKGRLLYESRNLVTLRAAFEDNHIFFHAQCKAQMKKLLYTVLLKLDDSGMIKESHCECAAGSGLEAHCKHVFVVLHGIEDIVNTKTIIIHRVCTDELMSFKRPRKLFYDSPIQAHNMPSKHKKTKSVIYCPIEEENIMHNYEDYVKNSAIAFASTTGSKMPYLQTIAPCNPYALEIDHNYCKKDCKGMLLENLLLKDVNQQQVEDLEAQTVQQNLSKEWHLHRSVRVTASIFHAVCHSKGNTREVLADNIICPRKFTSRTTSHGIIYEPVALEKYEACLSTKINKCGLFISQTHPFLGASPDGLLGDETVVEVKCPFVSRYCYISPNTVPYLYEVNGELMLKKNHNYYSQIQGQLFCTNRKYCNLVVYTFKDIKVIYLERDEEFIKGMIPVLTSFYEEYLKCKILDKFLYKSYDSIIKPK